MTLSGQAAVSGREAEVLALIGAHLSNAQIAGRLQLSVRTVESHVSSLLRKLGAADRRELAALAPTVASAAAAGGGLTGLPAQWTSFVGRERERTALLAALGQSRLVSLTGPGGVGKTRLATAVAADAVTAFPSGGTFVELVAVRPEFVTQAVATVLGVAEQPQRTLEQVVYDRLAASRGLLVLDNCEHVLSAVAGFVTGLLAASREITVLLTSRERLGVAGERVMAVPPLSLVSGLTGGPAQSEAERLFLDRARAADPGFADEPALVSDLCTRLDGMPLAIELAAARSASLGATGLLTGLGDQLRLLTGGRSADERHRSLRSVLDWSYGLLSEDEQSALCRLSVFAGGFDLAAVAAVATAGSAGTAADLLGRLVDKSLVVHRRKAGGSRWHLLETVRVYALDRLSGSSEDGAVRERHLRWAAATAATLRQRLDAGQEWRAEFDADVGDFRAALASAEPGPGPDGLAHELASLTGHLAFARWFFGEARRHHEHAAGRAVDATAAAHDLRAAADVAHIELNDDLSFAHLLAAAQLARDAGDRRMHAMCLADAVTRANRFAAAMAAEIPHTRLTALLGEATAAAPSGDLTVAAHLAQAAAWNESGQKVSADRWLSEQAVAAARAIDEPALVSGALDCLLSAYVSAGHYRDAYRVSRERLALLGRLPQHAPWAAGEVNDIVHMANEVGIAAGELPATLTTAREAQLNDIVNVHSHHAMAKLMASLVLSGEFGEAADTAEQMWSGWLAAGRPAARWMAPAVIAAALTHGLRGRRELYLTWWDHALQLMGGHEVMTARNSAGFAIFTQIRLAQRDGRIDEAVRLADPVLAGGPDWYAGDHWFYEAYAWSAAAETAVIAGLPDAADRLATAAPAGTESRWAQACLDRAWGRLGESGRLERSVAGWERIGARYERACTLLLLPSRVGEGRAELDALGCPVPAGDAP